MKGYILSIFLSLYGCSLLQAQTREYRFTRITVNQGLSHNQIKTVYKDRRGFVWIGTISGLNRYDGYNVRVFTTIPGDSTSLISSDVNKIFEGPDGKLWIHTWSGTNVYDPLMERFDRNTNRLLRQFSIPEGLINDIRQDSRGNYWFIHDTDGLYRYSPGSRKTTPLQHHADDTTSIASNEIACWNEDPQGKVWLLHTNGILERINPVTLVVEYRNYILNRKFRNATLEYNFIVDRDGELWFYIVNNNAGIFHFVPSTEEWRHINHTTSRPQLNTDIVRGIVQDDAGLLWIATDHGGINLLNKQDESVKHVLHNPDDEKSLSQNSINVLYRDDDGIIWAGTFKNGVSFYHRNINRFQLHRHEASNPESLPFNDINAIVEDERGNLWMGTNGGGLIYFDRARNRYRQYLHDPHDPNSLSTNVIVSLFIDRQNTLWIGTYFGGLMAFDGKRFVRYKHDPDNPASLSDNSVWEIFEDSHGNLWIGTLTRGVDRLDRRTGEFHHYNLESENPIHAAYIPAFMEDSKGNLWIGTGYGIDVLDRKTGKFIHYLNRPEEGGSLSNNSVLALHEDSRGLIWVATHGGLNLFDRTTGGFVVFTKADGLPHNSVLTILEDSNRDLWVSTPHGISHLRVLYSPGRADSLSVQFRNYDEKDGLQGIQFNENAACKTSFGELLFAGADGFNLFKPEEIGINKKLPRVNLTDFQIFNKSVDIGRPVNGRVILRKSISHTDSVVIDYDQNVFSIEFSSLSQFHPEKSRYRYMLEGFNREWTTTEASQRRVTYTNLDPGQYVFKVKAANNDGVWNEEAARLTITIRPPFWRSGTAFILYALATLGALMLARWLILYNARIKFQMQRERENAQRLHELDMIKIKFFTNVSHEFRTPLSLILTPVEKLLGTAQDGEQKKQFLLIHRNARRLLNLVNQLLDFRRMEVRDIRLNASEGDIVQFIREVFYSFSDLSEKNNIHFTFHTSVQQLGTLFDQDKVEKILFNLLSNAFKFTPGNGTVSISLDVADAGASGKLLEIKVKDSGIGIAPDKQEKIFERFFQDDLPRSMVNQGSGIGLSITREFVRIHGGSIRVDSQPGKGSCFTVLLPLTEIHDEGRSQAPDTVAPPLLSGELTETSMGSSGKKPVLLIVEDNEDFRFYLKDNLKFDYTVVEADNGREGFHRAVAALPDLIVSDVMMPEMDGIEFCRKIKDDERTSHIPFIMLTARTSEEQRVEGYNCGANDYITKPFNFEILQSRIRNLISERETMHRTFQKHMAVRAGDIQITSLDQKLISKAIKIVEENISEPGFSVEKLSRELGMSRVHLYKKLLSLTGKSPIEFIRMIRLQRAAQLLEKSQLTVSEIAYQVGFNNPKYFSKYFKDQFKMLPSVYANTVR